MYLKSAVQCEQFFGSAGNSINITGLSLDYLSTLE